MNTQQKQPKAVRRSRKPTTGRYALAEAASAAKITQAESYIANIDMTLFKKNGHVE